MEKLELRKRAKLSEYLREGRERAGLSVEKLAETAELAGRAAADDPRFSIFSKKDREALRGISVTRHHVYRLENCPARPLSSRAGRMRLLAICLALDLRVRDVNRLAGGI